MVSGQGLRLFFRDRFRVSVRVSVHVWDRLRPGRFCVHMRVRVRFKVRFRVWVRVRFRVPLWDQLGWVVCVLVSFCFKDKVSVFYG